MTVISNKLYSIILVVVATAGFLLWTFSFNQERYDTSNIVATSSELSLLDSLYNKAGLDDIDYLSLVNINKENYLYFRVYSAGSGSASIRHGLLSRKDDQVYTIDYFGKYTGVAEGSDTISQDDYKVSDNLKSRPALLYYLQKQSAIDDKGRVPMVLDKNNQLFIAESYDKKSVAFVKDTGDSRPSMDFAEGIDNYNQLVLWTSDSSSESVLVQSGEIKDLSIKNLPVDYPRDKIVDISNPIFSTDGTRIYFTVPAWATSGAIFYYDIQAKQIVYVSSGDLKQVADQAEFAGMLIITQRKYVDGGGVLYCDFVINPDDGSVIKELGDCK